MLYCRHVLRALQQFHWRGCARVGSNADGHHDPIDRRTNGLRYPEHERHRVQGCEKVKLTKS